MMIKNKVSLSNIKEEIKQLYDYKIWHLLTLNDVVLDENRLEVQWIFSKYETMDEIVIFYVEVDYTEKIPSILDILPSAIMSQRELVDMFGIEVEGSEKGLYLDKVSVVAPLKGCSLW